MNKIYPCFWFNSKAAEAAEYYCRVFPGAALSSSNEIVSMIKVGGQDMMLLNGGPEFPINPAISLFYISESKEETDEVWQKLSAEGSVMMEYRDYPWSEKYGWLQDKYGISWQISYGKVSDTGQVITPSFLFTGPQQGRAEEAIKWYTSIFPYSKTVGIMRYAEGEGDIPGTVKHAQFHIHNYVMMAMDSSGAHGFTFTEGASMVVNCDDQAEIDRYWDKLTEGGEEGRCGWLKDKFGVSWQIVPSVLGKLMSDPARAGRVVQAFLKMGKFDIKTLENA